MKKLLIFFLIGLVGCNLAPRYELPVADVSEWKACTQEGVDVPECNWWSVFQDPCLDYLEAVALEQNAELEHAYQRVMEADAAARSSYSSLFPKISTTPTLINSGFLSNPDILGVSPLPPPARVHFQEYILPLNASYDFDLFGRNRMGYFASQKDRDSHAAMYEWVKLSLTSRVALIYFRIRAIDQEIAIVQETIGAREDTLNLLSERYGAGLIQESDVSRSKTQLENGKIDLLNLTLQRRHNENILSTLLGYMPSDFCFPTSCLSELPPIVSPGIPCELLEKRPDILAAEELIAAENARIGVAKSQYFPSLSILGSIGFASPSLSTFLDWKSRMWLWALSAFQTIYDGGKIDADVDIAKARFEKAIASYIDTVLKAFQDVEDRLVSQKITREKYVLLSQAIQSSQDTKTFSQERYAQGLVTYLDVVQADRELLETKLLQIRALYEIYEAEIELIRAIGGKTKLDEVCCE